MKTDVDKVHPINEWVWESCFLDLLADEENPDDIDDWASRLGWAGALASARDRVKNISRNNEGVWWPSKDWPDLPQFSDSSKVAEWFCNMKAARIRASLECNQKRLDYASSPGDEERQSVRDEEKTFRKTLEAIILDSLAAFASIQRRAISQEQEIVLSALIHSEVCASGTTADVSYGMARAFDTFFLNTNWQWHKLYRFITRHNQARGWNHQGNYLECIRQLVPLLENFVLNAQKEDPNYLSLSTRLVYFPAVFTLSDALRDCHRTTEAAWWIRSALKSHPSDYWKSRLNTELASFGEDGPSADQSTKPKLLNQQRQVEYLNNERKISEHIEIDDFSDHTSTWADALSWTIRWHEGDPFNLLGSIQGAAQSIRVISESLKKHLKKDKKNTTFDYCFENINKVMEGLRDAIQRNAKADSNLDLGVRLRPVFEFLSPENDFPDSDLKQRQRINIWKALVWLLPALEAMIDFRKELIEPKRLSEDAVGSKLEDWQKTLKNRLKEAWQQKRFADIAADQRVLEILKNEHNLCTFEQHRKDGCSHKPNCVTTTLTLGDKVNRSDSDAASADGQHRKDGYSHKPSCVTTTLTLETEYTELIQMLHPQTTCLPGWLEQTLNSSVSSKTLHWSTLVTRMIQ